MLKVASVSNIIAAVIVLAAAQAVAQPSPAAASQDFVQASIGADQYEIQAATVAITETKDAGIRAFAQEMVRDHTQLSEATKRAAQDAGLPTPPDAMSGDHARLLGALQSLTGPSFDKAYAHQQVLAHEETLVVEGGYARSGSSAPLKAAAQAALPMIERHLEMARALSPGGAGS